MEYDTLLATLLDIKMYWDNEEVSGPLPLDMEYKISQSKRGVSSSYIRVGVQFILPLPALSSAGCGQR
jgi:hypothetical protein